MRTSRWLWLVLVLVGAVRAQDEAALDAVVRAHANQGRFMGSVLVARGEQVLLSKGYGLADVAQKIPNEPTTKFRIGSVTKQFTAVAILLLEERGKLSVDDLVKKHLPDAPAAWDKVTIFHLLTHTSGIPSFTDFSDYATFKTVATTSEKLVEHFRDRPLDFEPGTRKSYSNSGYVLLGYLIEKISGRTYAEFLEENVFKPLGMTDSGYDTGKGVAHEALGYQPGSDGPRPADFVDMSVPYSAGSLYSTALDLWKWNRGLFGGKLLSEDSVRRMTTPFKDYYGFGVGVGWLHGHQVVGHAGGIEGFSVFLMCFPDEQVTVAVLGNLSGPDPQMIARELGAMMHGELQPPGRGGESR